MYGCMVTGNVVIVTPIFFPAVMARPTVSAMLKLDAKRITDAIACMLIRDRRNGVLREFKLKTRRRADLIALSRNGQISIVEIKSSPQDFLSDRKWTEYLQWADKYYFGVGEDFPLDILPKEDHCGIIITDGFDCHEVQSAPLKKLNGLRRNKLVQEMAKVSMRRVEYKHNDLLRLPGSMFMDDLNNRNK